MPKRNQPGCANGGDCCGTDCPDESCFDADGNESFIQINEVTFVITGLPTDLVYYKEDQEVEGGPWWGYRVTIFGVNAFEGTYIVEKDANCNLYINAEHALSLDYQLEWLDSLGTATCDVHDTGTVTVRLLLSQLAEDSNYLSAILDEGTIPNRLAGAVATVKYMTAFALMRGEPNRRCDYQDLAILVEDKSEEDCPVTGVTYDGSTATVTG